MSDCEGSATAQVCPGNPTLEDAKICDPCYFMWFFWEYSAPALRKSIARRLKRRTAEK